MSRLIFIRHPETNMGGTFCGHSDPELNTQGHAQLDAILDEIHAEDVRVVYSSDLLRAKMAAKAIASFFRVDWHARPALREINFGMWEGHTWSEIEARDPGYAQRWLVEYPNLEAPRGERFCDFEQRILREINQLTLMSMGECAVVVTHAGVLRVALQKLCGYTEASAWEQTRTYGCMVRYEMPDSQITRSMEVNS